MTRTTVVRAATDRAEIRLTEWAQTNFAIPLTHLNIQVSLDPKHLGTNKQQQLVTEGKVVWLAFPSRCFLSEHLSASTINICVSGSLPVAAWTASCDAAHGLHHFMGWSQF